jgi:hypothetical protein
MANEKPQETSGQQATPASSGDLGTKPPAPSASFVKKLLAKKDEPVQQEKRPGHPDQGVAQIPSTLLTVEYVDDSEGMDAALKEMSERLHKVEAQAEAIQETQVRLVAVINQQAKDIGRIVESLGRRIDRLYKRVSVGEAPPHRQEERPAEEERVAAAAEPAATLSMGSSALSPEVAADPEHQNAWRVARVLAADLEAYHEEAVREGVLYGTFYSVLREPVEAARKAYEQRVSAQIVEGYDYFAKALDELIARKRVELEEEGAL